jgi:hypothetical protein
MDIFSIPVKTTISRTLQGKSVIVGGHAKSGKSFLLSKASKPAFIMTENGVEGITGITPIPCGSWAEFKNIVSQLLRPQGRENFDTIVIDSTTNLMILLDKAMGQKLSTDKESFDFGSDSAYGKGTKAMRNELTLQIQKLTQQGYFVAAITHTEDKVDFDTGKAYVGTTLSDSLYGVMDKAFDLTIYLERRIGKTSDKVEYITHFTPKGGFKKTGGRFVFPVDSCETSFANFEKYFLEAMDNQAEIQGSEIVKEAKTIKMTQEFDFAALQDEFKELTTFLTSENAENAKLIQAAVSEVLGGNKKVKDLTANQAELLYDIINKLKNIKGDSN